jgi:ATP-dependent RNA helicase DDX31/DBP7
VADEIDEAIGDYKPQGRISSLFFNNPEIPAFAHRVVNPVSEPVFTSQKFKDLPIHPFMVSDALFSSLHVYSVREGWTDGYNFVS